jgi:predicted Zn-dependent peptidase
VNNILSNIEKAESVINNGGIVIGMTAEKLQTLKTNVQNALFNYKDSPRDLQKAILNLGQDLGLNQASWDNYFGETDDLTPEETNKRKYRDFTTTSKNAALDEYMKQHGL